MAVGESRTVAAYVTASTEMLINKLVSFTSSNEPDAMAGANGRVTAIGLGEAIITATAENGVSASCTVIVDGTRQFVLPAGLTEIEPEAFMGNTSLVTVFIPDGCMSIGSKAFAGCVNLQYVRIPASVSYIAEDAFEGCDQVVIDFVTP